MKRFTWFSLSLGKFAFMALAMMAVLVFSLLLNAPSAQAAVPTTINFQGRLANASGVTMANGSYNMRFRIHTAPTGGTLLWTETRETTNRVVVTNGLFTVQLGSVTPLTASIFNNASTLYFEIELPTPGTATCSTASCQTWTEGAMTPRSVIAASAYAMNAATLDGIAASGFIQNQSGSAQATSNYWISGNGRAGTAFLAPRLDTAAAGVLTLGNTNATSLSLGKAGVTTTANGALTSTGLLTGSAGASVSGAVTLNSSGANAVNINTGTSTGATTVGNSAGGVVNVQSATTVGITGTTSVTGLASGVALTVSNATSTGNILELRDNATAVFTVADGGAVTSKNTSTTAFSIQNASGYSLLTADTSTNYRLVLGTSGGDTVGTLLVLGNKTNAGDPTGVEGAMYYNSFAKAFRCYENGSWRNCVSSSHEVLDIKDEFMAGMEGGVAELFAGDLGWECQTEDYIDYSGDPGCWYNSINGQDANHPGSLNLAVGTTNDWEFASMALERIRFADFNRITFIVKTPNDATRHSNISSIRIGLLNDLGRPSDTSTHGVYFQYDRGDNATYWKAITRNNSASDTGSFSGENPQLSTTFTAGTWYRFEIIKNASGNYEFYVNGTLVATRTATTYFPDATDLVVPIIQIANDTGIAVGYDAAIEVDYFSMRTKGLTR